MSDDQDAVTIDELDVGMRGLGVARGLRRAAMSDARALAQLLVADGYPADLVRHRAEVCECCGRLSVTTFCVGGRRRGMH